MTPDELKAMSTQDILRLFQPGHCARCRVTLHETTTGNRLTDAGCMCSDCYYAELGKEIEEHPLGVPRKRRGS